MPNHPLDISSFVQGPNPQSDKPKVKAKDNSDRVVIHDHHWAKLPIEIRKYLTKGSFKEIDFNPLLDNLDDLSKLTPKWLNWAVPTYINGLSKGPVHDWLKGDQQERSFHDTLVFEHHTYRKILKTDNPTREISADQKVILNELDSHIDWLEKLADHQ